MFLFSPLFGEDEPILTNIFSKGVLNHQLVDVFFKFFSKNWNPKNTQGEDVPFKTTILGFPTL